MTDTVKFDPGIGELTIDFNDFINNLYSRLMSFRTIHQKRSGFKLYASKIHKYMKNNIAFYLGCLLWAYYIYNSNIDSPKTITGNSFYGLSEEQKENYDYMIQINFMENYFDCYERDTLYYTGKKDIIPQQWKNILSLYSEFLEKNKGFINTKTTQDIILPEKLKDLKFDFDINEIINKTIKEKNLEILMNIDNLSL